MSNTEWAGGVPVAPAGGGGLLADWEKRALRAATDFDDWWTARTGESGSAVLLRPGSVDTFVDLEGNLTWSTSRTTERVAGGKGWSAQGEWLQAATPAAVRPTGDIVMRACVIVGSLASDTRIWRVGRLASEAEDANFTSSLEIHAGSPDQIFYSHEYGAGSNFQVWWDLALERGDSVDLAVERKSIGGGDVEVRLWASVNGAAMALINVTTVGGPSTVDNTTHATGPECTGGNISILTEAAESATDIHTTFFQLLSGVNTSLAAEQAIIDAVGA